MKFLDDAPDIIRRALDLDHIFVKERPSQRVRELCKEAYLSYINGNFIASVILLRSIMETVLLKKLGIDRARLWELNKIAKERKLYDHVIGEKIDTIKEIGNKIVHNLYRTKLSEKDTRKLILYTQEILSNLLD